MLYVLCRSYRPCLALVILLENIAEYRLDIVVALVDFFIPRFFLASFT